MPSPFGRNLQKASDFDSDESASQSRKASLNRLKSADDKDFKPKSTRQRSKSDQINEHDFDS